MHIINGLEYNRNSIDFIQTEKGRAVNMNGSYKYEYNLTDHLGNVRYSFDIYQGNVRRLQSDDYYAFGLRKQGTPIAGNNRYLYNGKELQDELGQYDYGARFYDPIIGRFNTLDPLSDRSRRKSPYSYAMNNPIRFIDVDGMYAYPPDWVIDSESNVKWRNNVTSATDSDLKPGDTYIGKTGYYKSEKGYTIQLHNKETLAAGERSWDYYVPNNRYEQESEAQNSQTEVGNGNGNLPTLSHDGKEAVDGLSVVTSGYQLGVELIKNEPAVSQSLVKGAKGILEGAGTALGVVSLLNDGANIMNKGISNTTAADWIKLGISGGQLMLKANPWTIGIGLIYGVADAAGYNPIDYIFK
eukprot:Opistho-1_new@81987